jgi:hypothetical protein
MKKLETESKFELNEPLETNKGYELNAKLETHKGVRVTPVVWTMAVYELNE